MCPAPHLRLRTRVGEQCRNLPTSVNDGVRQSSQVSQLERRTLSQGVLAKVSTGYMQVLGQQKGHQKCIRECGQ